MVDAGEVGVGDGDGEERGPIEDWAEEATLSRIRGLVVGVDEVSASRGSCLFLFIDPRASLILGFEEIDGDGDDIKGIDGLGSGVASLATLNLSFNGLAAAADDTPPPPTLFTSPRLAASLMRPVSVALNLELPPNFNFSFKPLP